MSNIRPARRRMKRDINDLTDLRAGLYCRVSQDRDGSEKSTGDQEAEGRRWVERVRALLAGVYLDNDRSASRFATKNRPGFERLLADIKAGKLDVVWFWELSRSQRRLGVFAELRDLCRDMGVLWVIRDRVYDPANYADMMTLGMLSVIGENESEMTSQRVLRGKQSSAAAGRPLGRIPYGYRRVYDPATRQLIRQEPDLWDGDDRAVENSPAWVVREIFARIAAGDAVMRITRDLNERGIPSSGGKLWSHTVVLSTAKRRTYIGQQVHQGEVLEGVQPMWPPLVEAETFWAVQRILSDPARQTSRPARARRLLSNQIRCGECGGRMRLATTRRPLRTGGKSAAYLTYQCTYRSCTGIRSEALDVFVEEVIVRWLSDPEVCAELMRADDSETAIQARADAEQFRGELAGWRRAAEAGEVTPAMAGGAERGLLKRIEEADKRAEAALLPPVLRGNIGPQARAGWADLDLAVKRQIIQAVADIRVLPVGRGRQLHPVDRVDWRWLLGDWETAVNERIQADFAAEAARGRQRRAEVMRLRADGLTRAQIAGELGVSLSTVAKDIRVSSAGTASA